MSLNVVLLHINCRKNINIFPIVTSYLGIMIRTLELPRAFKGMTVNSPGANVSIDLSEFCEMESRPPVYLLDINHFHADYRIVTKWWVLPSFRAKLGKAFPE